MSSLLLFIIAFVAPWAVHLAPPRQRPVALVAVVAVLLLYAIFAQNPLGKWQLWVGLAAGILSILAFNALAATGRRQRSEERKARRGGRLDDGGEPTGEI